MNEPNEPNEQKEPRFQSPSPEAFARLTSHPESALSTPLRYGIAVLSVTLALGIAILLNRYHFRGLAEPLSLIAIAITVWYAGLGPAILALMLSFVAVDYFFIEPI